MPRAPRGAIEPRNGQSAPVDRVDRGRLRRRARPIGERREGECAALVASVRPDANATSLGVRTLSGVGVRAPAETTRRAGRRASAPRIPTHAPPPADPPPTPLLLPRAAQIAAPPGVGDAEGVGAGKGFDLRDFDDVRSSPQDYGWLRQGGVVTFSLPGTTCVAEIVSVAVQAEGTLADDGLRQLRYLGTAAEDVGHPHGSHPAPRCT